jgi:ADP-heptose:LPS heptosyltransferase
MGVADRVVARGDPLPDADLHLYICSLPGLLGRDIGSIPTMPYLAPPPDREKKFSALFAPARGRTKVGIVWSGSITFGKNHRRAQRLMQFFQGFALPGVQLYSLQKGPPAHELTALPRGGPIVDLEPQLADFADTAAAIASLDLVIMTDSAVAHLAGAMGKPVWVLLPRTPDFRWLIDRDTSPWYPSARLFRKAGTERWDAAITRVAAELARLAAT